MGEAELEQRLLARGWLRPEQLHALRQARARGESRPLADLVLAAGLVSSAQLRELLASSPGLTPASPTLSGGEVELGRPLLLRPGLEVMVERVLGQGGMGVVYLVRDPILGRQAALKLIRAPSPARRQRFQRETVVTARLDHPGIPPVYEAGSTPAGQDYLLMHYVAGESLAMRIERQLLEGAPDWRPLLEALVKVAEAVHYAHSRRVVHRDLKPDNVMLGAFGEVYLMDWGLARNLEESLSDDARVRALLAGGEVTAVLADAPRLTRDGLLVGTPGFMAPEQARAEEVGPAADIYALGCLLSCALVGRPPFGGGSGLELISDVERGALVLPRSRDPRVPAELDAIAAHALRLDPRERYPTAAALGEDLKAFLAGRPVSVHRYGPLQQTARLVRAHPTLFASLGLAFLLSLGAVVGMSRARAAAIEGERRGTVERAEAQAARAWGELAALGSAVSPAGQEGSAARARRVAAALEALTAAQRWHALAPDAPAARRMRYDAAFALGDEALIDEQWSLAERAYQAAQGLGVDDAQAVARARGVLERRQARTAAALRQAEELVGEAERGSLELRPDGLIDASFQLARWGDPEVALLLARRLEQASRACRDVARAVTLEAREPTPSEAAAGARPLAGLEAALDRVVSRGVPTPEERALVQEARRRLLLRHRQAGGQLASSGQILANEQAARAQPELRAARLCCEALGRLGVRGPPEEALLGYILAECDARRALPAAVALHRLAGASSAWALVEAMERFRDAAFSERVRGLIGSLDAGSLQALPAAEAARLRHQVGDLRGAIEDYQRALAAEPMRAQLWAELGRARYMLQDLEGAERDFDRALELDPRLAPALSNRGAIRRARGRVAEARADLERAVEADPDDAAIWFNLGNARHQGGDRAGALAAWDRALELDPRLVDARVNRGSVRQHSGELAGAEEDLGAALALEPENVQALINLGLVRRDLGRYDEALEALDRAVALAPKRVSAWFNRGLVRQDLEDYAGAAADLERALELDPRLARAWAQLAAVRLSLGRPVEALEAARQATVVGPDLSTAWAALAMATCNRGQWEEARRAAERGAALAPDDPVIVDVRAQLALSDGDLAGGEALLRRLGQLSPLPSTWLRLADVLAEGGRDREALALLDDALRRQPGSRELLVGRARLRLGRGDLAGARQDAEAALLLSEGPRVGVPLALRALIRHFQGQADGAEEDLRRAAAANPYEGDVWVMALSVHLERGDPAAARDLELVRRHGNAAHLWIAALNLLGHDLERAREVFLGMRGGYHHFTGELGLLVLRDPRADEELLGRQQGHMGQLARWLMGRAPRPPMDTAMRWVWAGLHAECGGDRALAVERYHEGQKFGSLLLAGLLRRRLAALER